MKWLQSVTKTLHNNLLHHQLYFPLFSFTVSAAEIVLIIISVIAGAALLGVVALKVYYEIPGLSDKARSASSPNTFSVFLLENQFVLYFALFLVL